MLISFYLILSFLNSDHMRVFTLVKGPQNPGEVPSGEYGISSLQCGSVEVELVEWQTDLWDRG